MYTEKHIIHLDSVDSTNNYAKQLITQGAAEGTVVLAQYQTKGRGQMGNAWESEAGRNLLGSVLLYPTFVKAEAQFVISEIVSLSLIEFLKREVDGVSIKWPNDIYVANKKIAGLLIEHSVKGSYLSNTVVGMGLNLNQKDFVSGAPNPVSLGQLTGKSYDETDCMQKILDRLFFWYARLKEDGVTSIHEAYLENLFRNSGWHSFSDPKGIFKAKIEGVGPFGELTLRKEDGSLDSYLFKEVEFIL